MVFGPHMQNFAEVVRDFVEQNGAVQVRDAAELEKVLGELLADEARREQLGRNALRSFARTSAPSTERSI